MVGNSQPISDQAEATVIAEEILRPQIATTGDPTPPRPKKRTKRQQKRERAIAAIRAQTLAGQKPSFKLVRARYRLPNATASRWMKEAKVA